MVVEPYRVSVDELVTTLHSNVVRGLDAVEAKARLDRDGPNALASERGVPAWRKFLSQFQDVLVLLLLAAAANSPGLWAYERVATRATDQVDAAGRAAAGHHAEPQ